jgi:hypothetical protein
VIFRQGLAYTPVLAGAVSCIILARFGLVSFLYVLPLGIMAAGYGSAAARMCLFLAAAGNGLWSVAAAFFFRSPWDRVLWGVTQFALIAAAFIWMMAPSAGNPAAKAAAVSGETSPPARIRGVYRFVIASCIGALLFLPVITSLGRDEDFGAFIRAQAEALSALYAAAAGPDVVEKSLMERYMTPDLIRETLVSAALRGGVMASCMAFFLINRQIALALVRVFRRIRSGGTLAGFRVPRVFIWVLSFSLLFILAGKKWGIVLLEIAAWNGLVVCGILYLVQGGGVAAYFIARANLPPFMRLSLNILLVLLIFSPGINVALLGGLILLGVAENWAPFRAPKINGPSSTPGT